MSHTTSYNHGLPLDGWNPSTVSRLALARGADRLLSGHIGFASCSREFAHRDDTPWLQYLRPCLP